ncbi:IMPACT family protein [Humibacillus xanthopallidus]|uniref:IMPACT family protein n=1 Tax=Humibacillus xanthopallidus TaxID=412689 RepID=UPI00384A9D8F
MPLNGPRRYVTLAGPARSEVEVRRSRFVCDVAPVSTETEARAFMEQTRAASRDARHHCTAFVLGPDADTTRSNDDGEPSGTAGAPMLEVLRGRGLTDVAAVVTRWFGGTLLGTGGLIRAYGDVVSAAVDVARLVTYELRTGLVVEVAGANGPRVENALRGHPACLVTSTVWSATGLVVEVAVEPAAEELVRGLVAALTSGDGVVDAGTPSWAAVPPA